MLQCRAWTLGVRLTCTARRQKQTLWLVHKVTVMQPASFVSHTRPGQIWPAHATVRIGATITRARRFVAIDRVCTPRTHNADVEHTAAAECCADPTARRSPRACTPPPPRPALRSGEASLLLCTKAYKPSSKTLASPNWLRHCLTASLRSQLHCATALRVLTWLQGGRGGGSRCASVLRS